MIQLGKLTFAPVLEHLDLLGTPVANALKKMPKADLVGVAVIDQNMSDTQKFCENYEVTPDQAANCVIVEGKNGEERKLAAVVVLGSMRADVNKVVRDFLKAKKVSFAQVEKAVTQSGMEFGAVTPIGLPPEWPILIDVHVAHAPYVIVGSGVRSSKLALPGAFLASLPQAHVVEGLALPKT